MTDFQTPSRDLLIDKMGRYRTQSLFRETAYSIKDASPLWTLKEQDPQGILPSLRQIYMELADPTEYEFAQLCFGSWRHLEHLCTIEWFKPYIQEYRDELEVKLRAQAVRQIQSQAKDPKGTSAAKYLAEAGWKGKKAKRGRPSKAEVEGELKRQAEIDTELEEDATRTGVVSLKTGTSG